MSSLYPSFAGAARPVRKTILSVLIGLMGGGVTVLAQQAVDAPAATSPAQTAQADSAAPAPSPQAAQAETSVPAAPPAEAAPVAAPAESAQPAPTAAASDSKPDQAAPDAKPEASATDAPKATPVSVAVGKNGKPLKTADKKVKKKKEKAPKLTPVSISQGTLTVDGWTGKARLNYDIADLKYIYMWAPGVGTIVVSNVKFPLGKEEPNAISGNSLTVDANGHTVQLYSEKKLLKEKKPISAWVYVDTAYKVSSAYPTMGYGNTVQAPYVWPGAKDVKLAKAGVAPPPPLPASMRAALASQPCVPAGSKAAGPPCPAFSAEPVSATSSTAPSAPAPTPAAASAAESSPAPQNP